MLSLLAIPVVLKRSRKGLGRTNEQDDTIAVDLLLEQESRLEDLLAELGRGCAQELGRLLDGERLLAQGLGDDVA